VAGCAVGVASALLVRFLRGDEPEDRSPDELHEEFIRRNGEWNREIDEALTELERVGREHVEREREPA
jgi:hypothetical protein